VDIACRHHRPCFDYFRSDLKPAHFLREKRGLFPGGKVPSFGDGVEMNEIVISALGPTAWSLVDLLREHAYGSNHPGRKRNG
jgi:hypothetical protein